MFENIRHDYATHGRNWQCGSIWILMVYRYGVWSHGIANPILRRLASKAYGLMHKLCIVLTHVEIGRTAELGRGFHIIHACNIHIHPQVVVGERCGVMHNVSIGCNNMNPGVPTIGDDVFIGVGACLFGGITIGDGAIIAANSLVTSDVPRDALAIGVPAKIHRRGAKTMRHLQKLRQLQAANSTTSGTVG